jgi:hypothetical protein
MKKRILAVVAVLALVGALLPAIVFAADTGTVSCTVSAVLVSVTVTDGSVAYGTLALNTTKSTLAAELNDRQTATNSGTVAENFTIKSSNATRISGTNWTLVTGTPSLNEFKHEFSTNGSFPGTAMTNSYTTLKTNVLSGSNQTFDLRITMPGSTTDYLEHTITVTVMASL